ncbi:nitroreductase family protein [Paenibacillus sp. GCM10023252]|uniref:nitroreductase family protein n=1 Tax=Paenibacillus sp. GCM10023252 TaxID=3252649 RepID=UPI0036134CE9
MTTPFFEAVQHRRSIYGISKEEVTSQQRIVELVEAAVKHTPSAFNSQSARMVILFGEHHDKLWDLTKEELRKRVNDSEKFKSTEEKMSSFRAGTGTVLFYEDTAVIQSLQEKFASYADKFPDWSHHSSGMHQYVIWTGLEEEGLGASLQHYNPIIDDAVREEWKLPATWKLIAQMPFGKPTAPPGEKQFQPLEARIKVFK